MSYYTSSEVRKRNFIFPPAVKDDRVFFAYNDKIYAVDIKRGRKKWVKEISGETMTPPSIAEDIMYVGSNDRLYAINISGGDTEWVFYPENGNINWYSLIISNVTIYFSTDEQIIYELKDNIISN